MSENLKKSIDDLKVELEKAPVETGLFEETLESAKQGIERLTPESVQHLVQTLHEEAEKFEVDHPRITALINNVMTSLSNLGI